MKLYITKIHAFSISDETLSEEIKKLKKLSHKPRKISNYRIQEMP